MARTSESILTALRIMEKLMCLKFFSSSLLPWMARVWVDLAPGTQLFSAHPALHFPYQQCIPCGTCLGHQPSVSTCLTFLAPCLPQSLLPDSDIYISCIYMSRWIYAHEFWHLRKPEEGGSPGAGVRGSCDPLASGAGSQTLVLYKISTYS